ncbi:hypothetical protein MKW94_020650 [Papaver nudicaule]|uniref:Protein kinase domain-containing protein n=1 Tax=Papaver nudicaule TaxID=74823 RepID=A0AA41SKM1_PAPNU|nr:hypothetical protein [Papaver nudicaule]
MLQSSSSLAAYSSLSTLSISETSNQVLICSLVPSPPDSYSLQKSFLNCTNFPATSQVPVISPNLSVSGITGGNGFQCILSPTSSETCILRCWRFSGNSTDIRYKRIYRGPMLDELVSGNSHICARVTSTNRVQCWQWEDFDSGGVSNLYGIAVGGGFLCGLTVSKTIKCLGNDLDVVGASPKGTFNVVKAGNRHACAISTDGSLKCWGEMVGEVPPGDFIDLALGDNRTCALRVNGSLVCWGDNNFMLPEELRYTEFIRIEAKNSVFCGILTKNFSVFCWGNDEYFSPYSMVFKYVQPGPCSTTCPCTIVVDSEKFCSKGSICLPCNSPISPALQPSAPPPVSIKPGSRGTDKRTVALLVVGCVGTSSLIFVFGFFLFRFCKNRVCRIHDSGRLDQVVVQPSPVGSIRRSGSQIRVQASQERRLGKLYSMGYLQEFSLETVLKVTRNFSTRNKIGHGSFGLVYRAVLDDGREVAIKRAVSISTSRYAAAASVAGTAATRRQNDRENAFIAELTYLSRLNHKNLVRLLGYCEEENECALVYEYIANGTLHEHLHKLEPAPPLSSWTARLKIALDAARGIEYLHTYAVPSIIHRDIKSSNILLDASWTAKVADFGLSLLGPKDHEPYLSLRAAGTVGYMDPEYFRLQQLTTKSDVYSFGVVLLELLTGLKAVHPNETGAPRSIVDYIIPYVLEDNMHCVLDPKLPAPRPYEIEAVTQLGYLAADCVSLEGRNRPSMNEVASYLEDALAGCEVPQVLSPSTSR